jgi:hypothetical protein
MGTLIGTKNLYLPAMKWRHWLPVRSTVKWCTQKSQAQSRCSGAGILLLHRTSAKVNENQPTPSDMPTLDFYHCQTPFTPIPTWTFPPFSLRMLKSGKFCANALRRDVPLSRWLQLHPRIWEQAPQQSSSPVKETNPHEATDTMRQIGTLAPSTKGQVKCWQIKPINRVGYSLVVKCGLSRSKVMGSIHGIENRYINNLWW